MNNNESKKGLYIQMYNIHGLFRGDKLELGRDVDTGGQTSYVLELANHLSERDDIERVEVVTRWINDKEVSDDYAKRIEVVNDKFRIVRIKCGGGKYLRKEALWPHLEEFVDKSIKYIKSVGRLPNLIHSHYADAGYVGTRLSKFFGIPFIHTSHSLGRLKKQNMLRSGMKEEDIEKRYKITTRIEAEEETFFYADRIITSTNQEIEKQYGLYDNKNDEKFRVVPPGLNLERFYPYNEKREWDEDSEKVRNGIRNELWRFYTNMNKPIILTLCRPEVKKNIGGIIQAFGESEELRERANLAIFAGIRKDITEMPDIEREVLTEMLLSMDKYNLYGKMAIPKRHDVEYEVPELYRIAAETGGVFVNAAYSENFGLTLIEAASSGLPVVATDNGGPVDLVNNLKHGSLIDVSETKNISDAILDLLDDKKKWEQYSQSGTQRVKQIYTWPAHTKNYMEKVHELMEETSEHPKSSMESKKRLLEFEKIMIFDIDDTLLGDEKAMKELNEIIRDNKDKTLFGVATGRRFESAVKAIKENGLETPEVIICSVGTEMYYLDKAEKEYSYSRGWDSHVSHLWKPKKIKKLLDELPFLRLQEEHHQTKYKVSYYMDDNSEENLKLISETLVKNRVKTNIILSHVKYLDFVPFRSSKGRAVRYLAYRWNIPHENILVAGDSGNDEDMLTGELLGVVVANHTPELAKLKGRRRIYFAENKYAAGVIEGINHYKFLEEKVEHTE